MATRKKKTADAVSVVKGTHLTVTTFPDGTTKLEWDDQQLLKEVREAIAAAEQTTTPAVAKPRAARSKKAKTAND